MDEYSLLRQDIADLLRLSQVLLGLAVLVMVIQIVTSIGLVRRYLTDRKRNRA